MADDAADSPTQGRTGTKQAAASEQALLTEAVAQAVLASAKYAAIDPALVAALAAQELAKGARVKDAVKQVKNRLHQSVAAYWDGHTHFAAWRAALEAAPDAEERRARLLAILRSHHSTRERLPFLDDFYRAIFGGLGPIRRVLDLGCGLHPLALPWMNLPGATAYFACDVDREQMAFLAWWLAYAGQPGEAFVWNLLDGAPPVADDAPIDVALLLKIVPCLAQLDKQIGARLLDSVTAPVLIVSFPAQSLGGRRKGMVATYTAELDALIAGRGWALERFEFASELVFRLWRGGASI